MKILEKAAVILIPVIFISTIPLTAASSPNIKTGDVLLREDKAIIYGSLTEVDSDQWNETSFDVFFRWGKGIENTEKDTKKEAMSEGGEFVEKLTGLKPETIYAYKAVVQWNETETAGDTKHFKTGDFIGEKINVRTSGVKNISYTSAKLTGNISKMGFSEGKFFFRWWKEGSDLRNKTEIQNFSETDSFGSKINGLEPNSSYVFQAVAEVEGNQETGRNISFNTRTAYAEISDLSPDDGAEGIGRNVVLSLELSLPLEGEADVRFYRGKNDSLIDEVQLVNKTEASTEWRGLNSSKSYGWYVQVDYRNRTIESKKLGFSTVNETKIKNIEERVGQLENTVLEAETWINENKDKVNTSIVQNSLEKLKKLKKEAEEAAENGNYGLAEEKLKEGMEYNAKVEYHLEMLKETSDGSKLKWIIIVIIAITTLIASIIFVFIYFRNSDEENYGTLEGVEKPEDKYEELIKESEKD